MVLGQSTDAREWFVESINVTSNPARLDKADAVIIAIVDDGIRVSHEAIESFIWTNPGEIPGDGVDDDGNGYVDDVHGWDISDRDNVATPPEDRNDFGHGTHIAGIVAQMVRAAYGARAPELIRIMPVKALADDAPTTYIRDGYAGIDYATTMGADIIIAAWGVGQISPEEEHILRRAADAGIVIVASSGNLPEERDQYPAAHAAVLAVGSIEKNGEKTHDSAFGQFVDLSAPGSGIRSAGTGSDDGYEVRDGTSFSATMVATAAAMVKLQHPSLSPQEIEVCLKASSKNVPVPPTELKGKLGAGALNVQAAVACDLLFAESAVTNTLTGSKGFLRANRKPGSSMTWTIEPDGEYKGIRFNPVTDRKSSTDGRIEFRNRPSLDSKIIASYTLDNLPESIFIPGSRAYVSFEPRRKRSRADWLLEYEAETIDFSTIHCSATKEIRSEGVLADGSGPEDYSANTNCKWLITAPIGKVVHFTFDEIDTEPRTDMIYFFNGAGTNEKIMAIFSGQELPPELSTWSNQVLVWFVTNGQNQGRGWQARYRFMDSPQ